MITITPPSNQTKFCSSCGKPVAEDSPFCSNCGQAVVNSQGQPINTPTPPLRLPNASISGGCADKPIVVIIALIAALVAIISFCAGTPSLSGFLRGKVPHHGAFVRQFWGYTEIPTISYGYVKTINLSELPTLNSKPTILLWTPEIDLGFLQLEEEVGGMGTSISKGSNYPVISNVENNSGGAKAGLQAGDLIKEINGVSTQNFTLDNIRVYSLGPVGSSVSIKIERNLKELTLSVERARVETKQVPYEQSSDGQYWELTPSDNLSPGLYCYVAGSIYLTLEKLPAWCFMVK